jgi:hypothetical protein
LLAIGKQSSQQLGENTVGAERYLQHTRVIKKYKRDRGEHAREKRVKRRERRRGKGREKGRGDRGEETQGET